MAKEPTQHDCSIRFRRAMLAFRAELERIDKDTPATPTEEPGWWCAMSTLDRYLRDMMKDMGMIVPTLKDSSHMRVFSRMEMSDLQDIVGAALAEGEDADSSKARVKRLRHLFEHLKPWRPS